MNVTTLDFFAACMSGDTASLRSVVERGVSVNAADPNSGNLPLMLAVQLGHYKIAEALLDLGAQVNAEDVGFGGATALRMAFVKGDLKIAKLLVDRGTLVNTQDISGFTPLHSASLKGNTEAVKFLLNNGAKVNLRTTKNQSTLVIACLGGHLETAKLLLDNGAEVDGCNIRRVSPLMIASSKGHADIAKLLLDHGAEMDLRNNDGISAAYLASKYGHTKALRVLLDCGAEVDTPDHTGKTALIIASASGHAEVVKVLLEHGAKVNAQENSRLTALVRASLSGDIETVKVLLDHGAEAHSKGAPLSALNLVSWSKESDILQLLIEHSCELDPTAAREAQKNHEKALRLSLLPERDASSSSAEQAVDMSAPYFQVQETVKAQDKLVQKISRMQLFDDRKTQHADNLSLAKTFRELFPLVSHWQEIGIWLNLSTNVLAKIGDFNQSRERDCLREVLDEWLKEIDPPPTWEQLVHATRQVDEEKAEEIRTKYCK